MSEHRSNHWSVSYTGITFLEQVLSNHTSVASFTRSNDIQFQIRRGNGLSDVNAVLVNVYMFGVAGLYAVLDEFDGVTAIVNNGNWNSIAFDWRDIEKRTGVAAFLMTDFLGALNVDELIKYIPLDERKARHRRRRKSS